MAIQIKTGFDSQWLDDVVRLYQEAGLGQKDPELLLKAMSNSYCVVTCWEKEVLCGVGRCISDGVYYASIFDVAVHPIYQRKGIGRRIMNALEQTLPGLRFYLTATFGNERFYEHLGYQQHRTAMAKYPIASPYLRPLLHDNQGL